MPCSNCLSPNWGILPKYNATASDVPGTQGFREREREGNATREKCTPQQPWDHPEGGFLERRRTEEPKWGNPSLSSEKGWIPSRRLQPVPQRKRRGGQRALSSGRRNCRHFPRSGCKPIPRLPGETRGVPWVTEEMPVTSAEGQPEVEQRSAWWTPKSWPARVPGKHRKNSAGLFEWGRVRGGREWDSPLS